MRLATEHSKILSRHPGFSMMTEIHSSIEVQLERQILYDSTLDGRPCSIFVMNHVSSRRCVTCEQEREPDMMT